MLSFDFLYFSRNTVLFRLRAGLAGAQGKVQYCGRVS